jgi:hypothetical protein
MKNQEMKKVKEPYLKIPDHILSVPGLGPGEKMLLAHIYSFGARGCWQSNKTLAQIFLTSERTISRWLAGIKAFVIARSPKGYYRTVWVKSHPDVRILPCANLNKTEKHYPVHSVRNGEHARQKLSPDFAKNGFRPRQYCPTTINNTITENYNRTIASPPPLSGLGRTSATLAFRNESAKAAVKEFIATFGGHKQKWVPLPPEEATRRPAAMLAAIAVRHPQAESEPRPSRPPPADSSGPGDAK